MSRASTAVEMGFFASSGALARTAASAGRGCRLSTSEPDSPRCAHMAASESSGAAHVASGEPDGSAIMTSAVTTAARGAASRARRTLCRTNRSPHMTCSTPEAAPASANAHTSTDALASVWASAMSATEDTSRAHGMRLRRATPSAVANRRPESAATTHASAAPPSRNTWSSWKVPVGSAKLAARPMQPTTHTRHRPNPSASTASSNAGPPRTPPSPPHAASGPLSSTSRTSISPVASAVAPTAARPVPPRIRRGRIASHSRTPLPARRAAFR